MSGGRNSAFFPQLSPLAAAIKGIEQRAPRSDTNRDRTTRLLNRPDEDVGERVARQQAKLARRARLAKP